MTCMTQIVANVTLTDAMIQASARALYSYFDQHIIRTDDGCCWVADECSYETLMTDLGDRIVATVPADAATKADGEGRAQTLLSLRSRRAPTSPSTRQRTPPQIARQFAPERSAIPLAV